MILNRQIHTNNQTTLLILVTILFLLCISAKAYAYEVVAVKSANIKPYNDVLEGFKGACKCEVKELNLAEDKNITSEKISRLSPDAILAIGTDAFKKVKSIKDIPVIYAMIMPSEAHTALQENTSGVILDISPEAYINTIVKIFPKIERIGLIYDPQHTGICVKEITESANKQGITIISKIARNPSDVPHLIDGMKGKIDLFLMLPDPTVINSVTIKYMLLFSFQNRVPVFSFSQKYVEMGAVAAFNIDPFDMGFQAGVIARKLPEGPKYPIRVYAKKVLLIINTKIAIKLGINIKNILNKKA